MTADTYERLQEALDFYEQWLDYWAGLRDVRPKKPRWIPKNEAEQIKMVTQRIVKAV